jgi:hypothetical protein
LVGAAMVADSEVLTVRNYQEAKTIFKRMFYDKERDESVVHCGYFAEFRVFGDA